MASADFSLCGLKSIVDYDHATGKFTSLYSGKPVGSLSKQGYVKIAVFGKCYGAHRIAWFFVHGKWPDHEIDHIDGNKANNVISNLRDVPHKVNMNNMQHVSRKGELMSKNNSGLRGVYKAPFNKWMARITVAKKTRYLGHFDTKEDAQQAYVNARINLGRGA